MKQNTSSNISEGLLVNSLTFFTPSTTNFNSSTLHHSFPCRCKKYGVGKKIGHYLYVAVESTSFYSPNGLGIAAAAYADALNKSSCDRPFNVVKIDVRDMTKISLIYSPDFDTANEPRIDYVLNCKDGKYVLREMPKDNPYIYHHKWLFVDDDYKGFDVEESKQRSRLWLSVKDIDFCRIGRKKFWDEFLKNNKLS